jgi:hypothetical protein
LAFSLLFVLPLLAGGFSKPADAQVVVKIGPQHHYYHHHHYYEHRHAYYSHGHWYYRYY